MRGIAVGLVALAFAASASAAGPSSLPTSVEAPGVQAGPVITAAGLVWEGPSGVVLDRPDGSTRLLAPPGRPNADGLSDLTWFGERWWALAEGSQVVGGPIGGPLRKLALPESCNPGSIRPRSAPPLLAVAGSKLYAALPPGCLGRVEGGTWPVYAIDLRSGRARFLFEAPGQPQSIAAGAGRLAVAYVLAASVRTPREAPARVALFGAHSGSLLARVEPPRPLGPFFGATVQLDSRGDVLVASGGCCAAGSGALSQVATAARAYPPGVPQPRYWWAPPGARAGRRIALGRDAVLSAGKVASLAEGGIVLTDLRGGARQLVSFSGAVEVVGLALSGGELAWTQVSSALVRTGPNSCESVELSPPRLALLDLRGGLPRQPFSIAAPPAPGSCPIVRLLS